MLLEVERTFHIAAYERIREWHYSRKYSCIDLVYVHHLVLSICLSVYLAIMHRSKLKNKFNKYPAEINNMLYKKQRNYCKGKGKEKVLQ